MDISDSYRRHADRLERDPEYRAWYVARAERRRTRIRRAMRRDVERLRRVVAGSVDPPGGAG